MAITLRLTKGSELTFQELDDNFTDLNSRVSTLETSDANDISLTSLSVTTASAGTAGLSYNNTTGVFTYTPPDLSSLSGTTAETIEFTVHNDSGGVLTKGEVVYISGLNGNTPEVSKAQANSSTTMPAFGIVKADIANTADGTVITFGSCPGHDAANFGETGITFALGDTLYISATEAGKLTNVAPAGESNLIQNIGKIERATPTTNMTIKVGGAGRTNATPNLNDGNIFIGNAQHQSSTASFNGTVDAHLNTGTAGSGEVLSWTGTDYDWVAQSGGVALSDLSVTTASASGTPSLAYNNTTGVFTYTPPDLSNAIVSQAQYTTTVTTDAADPTDTAHHVLGNTGTPSIHNSSTAWYYGDVVHDPANPTTSVVLDIDSGILTGDVVGDITSAGTSTFNGTVDFSSSSNVDFTGATVSGLPNDTWATLGDKNGPGGPSQIALGTNAGNVNQGANSIAIGAQAGVTNQAATSIVINATGIVLDNAIPESFVVKPVRGLVTAQALYYDVATGEVTYGAAPSGGGGTFALAGNTGTHTFNTATETLTFLGTTGQINAGIAANNVTLELDPNINSIVSISFEGATADNFETKLQAVDPTADRTINLPDADGTVALLSDISAGGLPTRSTKTGNTNSLADAAEADLDITGFKAYALLAITTDRAARVRLYVSAATRTADASRAEGVDPTSDAGLIAEVITTGAETVIISPGAYGFNLESSPTTTIPCRVTNKSGGTATVQVTLNVLQLEA